MWTISFCFETGAHLGQAGLGLLFLSHPPLNAGTTCKKRWHPGHQACQPSTLSAELLYKNKSSPQRKHGNGGHGLKRSIVLKSDLIKLLQKNIIFELSATQAWGPGFDPQHPWKGQGVAMYACNPSIRRRRQMPGLQIRWKVTETSEVDFWPPDVHAEHAHHPQTHSYATHAR